MFGKVKGWICSALTALAVSASASISIFQPLEKTGAVFPMFGNVTQASPLASSSFSYDSMNRLTNSSISVNSCQFAIQNSYDLNGNRTNITYPGGLSVSYSYDAEDRLVGVTADYADDTDVFSFGYDSASRLTNIVYPNGVNSAFDYDAESRITGYRHGNFHDREIIRDARGFKTSENIVTGLEPSFPEGEQRFENDDADRLTRITQRDTWLGGELNQWYYRNYTYDDNGGLLEESVVRPLWNTNSVIDEYRSDYAWDYDNRLTGAEKTVLVPHDEIDGMTGAVMDRTYTDGPSISTEYIYDASGVRIGRVHNSVTNYFVVDYNAPLKMPLAETDAQGNITRYYIWSSHGLLAHLDVDPDTQAITATRYYHADEQGSTLALTDESGAVTDQFAYTPYGGVNRTGTTDTSFQWLGGIAVQSEGDGLYFMLNRYYSATTKKFISPDPSGIDGGINLYAYAGLNPLAFVDPYGLCATSGSSYDIPRWENYTPGYSAPRTTQMNSAQYEANAALTLGASFYPDSPAATMIAQDNAVNYLTAAPFAVAGEAIATGLGKVFAPNNADEFVDVYRAFGGDARAQGFSWTTKDPRAVRNFRDVAGLPSGGASGANNSAEFLIKGRARAIDIIESRPALPLDGNRGGLPELIIDPNNVNLIDFSILKP